jgi:hypothetical protein
MPNPQGTLEALALTFAEILISLKVRLESDNVGDLFAELGLQFPPGLERVPGFSGALQAAVTALDLLPQQRADLFAAIEDSDSAAVLSTGIQLTGQIAEVVQCIDALAAALDDAGAATGLPATDVAEFAAALPSRLTDYLIVSYLKQFSVLVELLEFIGVIEAVAQNIGSPDPNKPPYTEYTVRLDQIFSFLASPADQLETLYGWGSAGFNGRTLLQALSRLLLGAGVPAIVDTTATPDVLDVFVFEIRPKTNINPRGLSITIPEGLDVELEPIESEDFTLNVTLDVPVEPGLEILIQPDDQITAIPAQGSFQGEAAIEWIGEYGDGSPFIILGKADGSRWEAEQLRLKASVSFDWNASSREAQSVLKLEGEIIGGLVVIDIGLADSFIGELLAGIGLESRFDLGFGFSSQDGFYFYGSNALDIQLPLSLKLGPVTINMLVLGIEFDGGDVTVQLSADVGAALGIIGATLHQIGATARLTMPPERDGNLGIFDFGLDFKPPDGVTIGFDFAGLVYGSGRIDFFPDTGQYTGVISVQIVTIGVVAIAIISTQLPDDPGGWSMLVSINVDLGGIPLGFGFTLEKVGGLVGVHRTIDTAVLQSGIRTGILDSILFPEDPVGNLTQILNDMEAAFPAAQGSFVVGAMLQIGWGTPTMITADLGLIIQVPDVIIALIGQAEAILPFDDFALIEVHFDVLGILDLAAGTLAIDAGLRDSHIVGFVLTGQMALRASFLTNPSFLLSLGGFHPAFPPPDNFPILDRMGVGISLGDWLSIAFEAYLALTSNTVQFGAGLYLTASLVGFKIEGGTDINTLIQFIPFQFRSDLRFYITVSAASVELLGVLLTGSVSGPNPYFVHGQAQFRILGLQKEVDIEETIGGETDIEDIDEVPLLDEVIKALEDPQSWSAVDDGVRLGGVLLAGIDDAAAPVVLHPGGKARVLQRLAPLGVELEHFGSAEIQGEDTLSVTVVEVGGSSSEWEFAEDWFAPAQFFDYTNDEKLSAPSFEMMKGGLTFGDDEAEAGSHADAIYNYQQIKHDPEFNTPQTTMTELYTPDTAILSSLTSQKAVRIGSKTPTMSTASGQTFKLASVSYAIVDRASLLTPAGTPTRTRTYAEAAQAVRTGGRAQIVVTISERQSQ